MSHCRDTENTKPWEFPFGLDYRSMVTDCRRTPFAVVLGMLPQALGRGIRAEMRNGVRIASAGGILVSRVLTLIVIPILYHLFTRGKNAFH